MTACPRIQGTIRAMWCGGRSGDLARDVGAGAEAGVDEPTGVELVKNAAIVGEMVRLASHLAVPVEAQPLEVGDRKSTRLNSSHSSISYAVFCLKKKKIKKK